MGLILETRRAFSFWVCSLKQSGITVDEDVIADVLSSEPDSGFHDLCMNISGGLRFT